MRAILFGCLIALASDGAPAGDSTNASVSADGGRFLATSGEELYRSVCAACHMSDAGGAKGAGQFPSLRNNPTLASAPFVGFTVLYGRRAMPPLGSMLSDEQIAAVTNYVRRNFGNSFSDTISVGDIRTLRASSK